MPELEVRHLTKRYGKTVGVDDLSFLGRGGAGDRLLGPNGADGSGHPAGQGLLAGDAAAVGAAWFLALVALGTALTVRRDLGE